MFTNGSEEHLHVAEVDSDTCRTNDGKTKIGVLFFNYLVESVDGRPASHLFYLKQCRFKHVFFQTVDHCAGETQIGDRRKLRYSLLSAAPAFLEKL